MTAGEIATTALVRQSRRRARDASAAGGMVWHRGRSPGRQQTEIVYWLAARLSGGAPQCSSISARHRAAVPLC